MKKIPLYQGKFALIDDDDFERVNRFKLVAVRFGTSGWYVYCEAKGKRIFLHRLALGLPQARFPRVDHKDRNGLNNQKSNLRFCTGSQNKANQTKNKNNKSGFKGVSWSARDKNWKAYIGFQYKTIALGLFENKIDAAIAYDEAAKKYFGEFALLNNPKAISNV